MGPTALNLVNGQWTIIVSLECVCRNGGKGKREEMENKEYGELKREAEEVIFDLIGSRKSLTDLIKAYSSHNMQDNWKEHDQDLDID